MVGCILRGVLGAFLEVARVRNLAMLAQACDGPSKAQSLHYRVTKPA
jgi:hypothetical protein